MKFFALVLVLAAAASGAVSADDLALPLNCSLICPCTGTGDITREDNFSDDSLPGCPAELETSLLGAVNRLRKDNLLSPLEISTEINQYSQVWATYLSKRNIYYHEAINNYGSDLIYSYRLHSDDTPINGNEAVDFWINTNGIAPRAGNEFENNLDTLFDPRSERIGFGCALAAKSLERAHDASARSYERQARYFVVANIEVNPNRAVSPSCYYDYSRESTTATPELTSSYPTSANPSSQYPSSLYASSVSSSSLNPSTNPSTEPSTSPSSSPSTEPSTSPSSSPSTLSSTVSTTLGNPTIPDLNVTLQPGPSTTSKFIREIDPTTPADDDNDDLGILLKEDPSGAVFLARNKTLTASSSADF